MGILSRREALAAGAGAVSLAGLTAVATGQPRAATPAAAAANAGGDDPAIASCLLIKGRRQIEVCRFALDKLQNDDVKAFAKAEIEEHETMKKKLETLGYRYPVQAAGAPGTAPAGAAVATVVPLPEGAARMIAIDHEVADQCIATQQAELGKKTGLKFDKGFVGDQLHTHYGLFDHGVVFRKHTASPQMAAALDEAKTIIEQHIARCKELMEKLEGMQNKNA